MQRVRPFVEPAEARTGTQRTAGDRIPPDRLTDQRSLDGPAAHSRQIIRALYIGVSHPHCPSVATPHDTRPDALLTAVDDLQLQGAARSSPSRAIRAGPLNRHETTAVVFQRLLPPQGSTMPQITTAVQIPRTPPACKYCAEAGKQPSVKLSFTHDSVEYWHCGSCGRRWSGRQGRGLVSD